MAPFHGNKKDESPEDFLHSFYRHMGTATDKVRRQQFLNFLQAYSVADKWFEELAIEDKKSWNSIEVAFHKRWPKKKAVKKTIEEYEEEITGLPLKMEDLGKKEMIVGREVYTHVTWADKMETIVIGAKSENTVTYIGHICKELPKLVREKVGTGHKDWTTFLQAICDIDVDHIREGVDIWKKDEEEKKKEQDKRKKKMDKRKKEMDKRKKEMANQEVL